MVWLPSREGQSLPQVVDDELAYIEHFVDALPADAGLLIYSKALGTQALAVAMGLLARRVGWERAGELAEELRQPLPGKVGPNTLLVEAWRRRLSASPSPPQAPPG